MIINLKSSSQFEVYLENTQQRINTFLANILPKTDSPPQHLHEAMHYAVLNGGKRIRPLLVYATGEVIGIDPDLLDYPAGAVELIHAYSLVHDDLPAMDNDDLRRGKPTCHKAYDEATAILVGDALQALAFNLLSDSNKITPATQLAMVRCLAKASGSLGMAGGQALDLRATGQHLKMEQLELIHQLKTGALIGACVELATLAGHVTDTTLIQILMTFAKAIGLCFQIQDDILDIQSTTQKLGKAAGADIAKQKATFTTINGLSKAQEWLQLYYDRAITALNPLGERASHLKLLADFIIFRDH